MFKEKKTHPVFFKSRDNINFHHWYMLHGLQPNPALAGAETKMRLGQIQNFILMESFAEAGKHIGVLANGQLKSALVTHKEPDAHFGVRLIVSFALCGFAVTACARI